MVARADAQRNQRSVDRKNRERVSQVYYCKRMHRMILSFLPSPVTGWPALTIQPAPDATPDQIAQWQALIDGFERGKSCAELLFWVKVARQVEGNLEQ
jgi:hypothetical protein